MKHPHPFVALVILLFMIYNWCELEKSFSQHHIVHSDIETLCRSMSKNSTRAFKRQYRAVLAAYKISEDVNYRECMRMLD